MNLVSIKKTGDMRLDGVTIDAEWRDKSLAAVTLTDANGHVVRFALENYRVGAYIQAPPEKKTVHVVAGKVRGLGTEVREQFDDAYSANSRRSEIEQADVLEDLTVTTEDVEVPF